MDAPCDVNELNAQFEGMRSNIVTSEASSNCDVAQTVRMKTGLANMLNKLEPSKTTGSVGVTNSTMTITTGSEMESQFNPGYFLAAYCFNFPLGTGQPDWGKTRRRIKNSPRVEMADWCRAVIQHAELHFRADFTLGAALWNFLFRQMVNNSPGFFVQSKTTAGEKVSSKTFDQLSGEEFKTAAIEICNALDHGTYRGHAGERRVDQDITKLKYVTTLSPLAKSMVRAFSTTCSNIPGTADERKMQRHELLGYQVVYGRPDMYTASPTERHDMVMIRLHRTRKCDPMAKHDPEVHGAFGGWNEPSLEGPSCWDHYLGYPADEAGYPANESSELIEIPVADIPAFVSKADWEKAMPSAEVRRKITARDPLACLYGFRTLVTLILDSLLGVRVCKNCPDCNWRDDCEPCCDDFGSVAKPQGGTHGRVDAYYGCIEAQKYTKSLHVHIQAFRQRLLFPNPCGIPRVASARHEDLLRDGRT